MCDIFRNNVDEDDDGVEFKINRDYAAKYDNWRQKEELEKLKSRYGDVNLKDIHSSESSSSSSSESEDENLELNPSFEKDFFRTLSCLMSQDPKIYDKNVTFFKKPPENNKSEDKNKKHKKKEKPMYLKDYERKVILEKGGVFTDEEDSDNEIRQGRSSPTYVEEEKQIKDSFKTILEDSDEGETEDLFQEKKKTKREAEQEENDYSAWLKCRKNTLNDDTEEEMKHLRDYWNDPKLDSGEAFLRDYILNKKYLDVEDESRVPDYDEIIHDSEDLSEDEKTLQKQEEFEHKYNFRFEEPDAEFIKHYPRTMDDTLRRINTQRKDQRDERKTRKLQEKEQKKEELKRLKALKRKEILQKLERLKRLTGNTNVGFDDDDFEGEFDSKAHDDKMHQIFDDGYYQVDGDDEKPVFSEDDEMDEYGTEDWDNWTRQENHDDGNENNDDGPHCEDPDFNMDADYDPRKAFQEEMVGASTNQNRRRKSKFAELVNKAKPLFDPDNNEKFEEYLDEYYKLDYEDLIDDLPCRFKYRKVVPNDFGLTMEEILGADDKELNQWCSLKKAYQYRTKERETYDVHAYQVKAKNTNKKKKILTSVYAESEEKKLKGKKRTLDVTENGEAPTEHQQLQDSSSLKKKSRSKIDENHPVAEVTNSYRKEKKKHKGDNETAKHKRGDANGVELQDTRPSVRQKKNMRKRKKKQETVKNNPKNKTISDERLRAYGINPKKFKQNKKF